MALQYLYMDEIRAQIRGYVEVHNNHPIRKQKNRDYLPTGRPYELYNYPRDGIQNYAEIADPELLALLQAQVQDWNPDIYLTLEVEAFCAERLRAGSFPPKELMNFAHDESQHQNAYKYLRQQMVQYIQEGGILEPAEKPLGACQWILCKQNERQARQERENEQLAREDQGQVEKEIEQLEQELEREGIEELRLWQEIADAKDWGNRVLSNPGLDLDNSPAPDDGYISEVFVESDNEEMTGESKS